MLGQAQFRSRRDEEQQEGDHVDHAHAHGPDQQPRRGRRHHARHVHPAHLQRDRVHELVLRHQLRHQRLSGRHIEGEGRPRDRGSHEQVPEHNQVREDEDGQDQAHGRRRGLRQDEQSALVDPVRHDAADRGEEEHGDRDADRNVAQRRRRPRHLERQEPAQQMLHLHAHEEGQVAREEPGVVALAERREGGAPRARAGDAPKARGCRRRRLRAAGALAPFSTWHATVLGPSRPFPSRPSRSDMRRLHHGPGRTLHYQARSPTRAIAAGGGANPMMS